MPVRYEKWLFRTGVVGLVLVIAFLFWQESGSSDGAGRPGPQVLSEVATQSTEPSTTSSTEPAPGALPLSVASPLEGATTTAPSITFSGFASAGAIVSVGAESTVAGDDGSWRVTVDLQPGDNQLLVRAELDGRRASLVRVVTRTATTARPSSTPSRPAATAAPSSSTTSTPSTTTASTPSTTDEPQPTTTTTSMKPTTTTQKPTSTTSSTTTSTTTVAPAEPRG